MYELYQKKKDKTTVSIRMHGTINRILTSTQTTFERLVANNREIIPRSPQFHPKRI